MPEEKAKPVTLRPTVRMSEMVTAIMREKGLNTLSSAYFYAIGELYHKLFPTYSNRRGVGGEMQDPNDVGRRKVQIKAAEDRAREEIATAERANICVINLKGHVVNDIDGKFCVFNTYQFDQPDEQRVPLDMITSDFASHQQVEPQN